jgi:hypothetical protein
VRAVGHEIRTPGSFQISAADRGAVVNECWTTDVHPTVRAPPDRRSPAMKWNTFSLRRTGGEDIALVTANFGGIDDLKPLPPHQGIVAYYYTDAASLSAAPPDAVKTWTRVIVPNYPRHDFNPRLRGRYFKHQIHRLDEVRNHRWLVWADSSLQFNDLGFLADRAAQLARLAVRRRVLLVPHPDRQTISQELHFIQDEIDRSLPVIPDDHGIEPNLYASTYGRTTTSRTCCTRKKCEPKAGAPDSGSLTGTGHRRGNTFPAGDGRNGACKPENRQRCSADRRPAWP